eukprot:scaffold1470_cov384-Prasinococcus_capsulatus_cf.AAC.1
MRVRCAGPGPLRTREGSAHRSLQMRRRHCVTASPQPAERRRGPLPACRKRAAWVVLARNAGLDELRAATREPQYPCVRRSAAVEAHPEYKRVIQLIGAVIPRVYGSSPRLVLPRAPDVQASGGTETDDAGVRNGILARSTQTHSS